MSNCGISDSSPRHQIHEIELLVNLKTKWHCIALLNDNSNVLKDINFAIDVKPYSGKTLPSKVG